MRIISQNTLKNFWKKYADSEQPLKAWYDFTKKSNWDNHNKLKMQVPDASIINNKRVVFNIKGNDYRLVVDIEYSIKIVFIVWIGTHAQYDKIDIKNLSYDKTNKNKKRT